MARRFQFSLRTALLLVFVIALVAWPTTSVLRSYLASRGLVPVAGYVEYNGQPLGNATVTFIPTRPGAKALRGTTDAAGHFQTETPATPGAYGIAVAAANGGTTAAIKAKYTTTGTSGLIVVIRPGDNRFRFFLGD